VTSCGCKCSSGWYVTFLKDKGNYLVCPMEKEKHPGLKKIVKKWRGAVWFNSEWRGSVGAAGLKHGRFEWIPEAKGKKYNWGEKLGLQLL
jgi:hypothetical protein